LIRLQQELGISIPAIIHNLNAVRHNIDRMGIMYFGKPGARSRCRD
jgi:ABC-type oligopeptide transport system ATPase subunit